MMPGTQFLTPTVHCPGCGELIDFLVLLLDRAATEIRQQEGNES